jgi:malate synthase
VLLQHNGLHLDIRIDRNTPIGASDAAGVADLVLESALSTILDLEDSVAVVDADDKVLAYGNWLGILQGTLTEQVAKGGSTFTRGLNPDRVYAAPGGGTVSLHGRSLMFVRNVGHLMCNPAVLWGDGQEIPEGILDAIVTTTIALHDLQRHGVLPNGQGIVNSRKGSVYIVKPKMHGPAEVAFASELFGRVEKLLGLPQATVKLGIMDEERRTSVNLKACIAAAADRVAFINTGFLDRTGDEMHTAMLAGPMLRKGDMKTSAWIQAYERNNVLVGLQCGLRGKAQIGKGMWAMPDLMAEMLSRRSATRRPAPTPPGCPAPPPPPCMRCTTTRWTCSRCRRSWRRWMPTPSAPRCWKACSPCRWSRSRRSPSGPTPKSNRSWTTTPRASWATWCAGSTRAWAAARCPTSTTSGLMEDRATLRISSQHMANWLHHGVVDKAQVRATLKRMAKVVDKQNAGDAAYTNMAGRFKESAAFQAASDLVFKGMAQPSGYTEPLLHAWRLKVKAAA